MNLSLKDSVRNLWNSPLRTLTCIACMAIGIACVTLVFGLNLGYVQALNKQFGTISGQVITLSINNDQDSSNSFQYRDLLTAVQRTKSAWRPSIEGTLGSKYQQVSNNQRSTTCSLIAVEHRYVLHKHIELSSGRFLTETDAISGARVAILGSKITETLFKNSNPIGKEIFIGPEKFRVVGVLKPSRSINYLGNREVIIPFASALQIDKETAASTAKVVFQILGDSKDSQKVSLQLIKFHLQQITGIRNKLKVSTGEDVLIWAKQLAQTQTLIFGAVAAIIVVVAGIAIMNIYFIGVIQRTSEIGIRISVGATKFEILKMLIRESTITAIIGILFGIPIAIWVGNMIGNFTDSLAAPIFSFQHFVYVSMGSIFVALLFTIAPAISASKKNPIVAINTVGV